MRSRRCASSKSPVSKRSRARWSRSSTRRRPSVDLFDLALAPGEHPRLFLDMIAFVDMAHDKRTYRFFQDTRQGRLLMAESQSADTIVSAVADYVARRLVERERALTVGPSVAQEPPSQPLEANGPAAWPIAKPRPRALHFPPPAASGPLAAAEQPEARRRARDRATAWRRVQRVFDASGSYHVRSTAWGRRLLGLGHAPARPLGSLDWRAAILNLPARA